MPVEKAMQFYSHGITRFNQTSYRPHIKAGQSNPVGEKGSQVYSFMITLVLGDVDV